MPDGGHGHARPGRPGAPVRLEIVVAPDCLACEQAHVIAREVQARHPALHVDVIELDGQRLVPTGVVATPTYLLDGAVIALGNPRRDVLLQEIARRRAQAR